MTDLNPADIMAEHEEHGYAMGCRWRSYEGVDACETYRLAAELAEARGTLALARQDHRALLDSLRDEPEVVAVQQRAERGEHVENPLAESVGVLVARYARERTAAQNRTQTTQDGWDRTRELLATTQTELAVMREREQRVKADAWDQGARAEQNRPRLMAYPPNPYRAALAGEGADEGPIPPGHVRRHATGLVLNQRETEAADALLAEPTSVPTVD